MKTLYLHIGTPKTATTSIQVFCNYNREVLNAKGYDYPLMDFQYKNMSSSGKENSVKIRRNAHFLFGDIKNEEGKADKKLTAAVRKYGFDMLRRSFAEYDNVILSDEGIWHFSARKNYFSMWPRLQTFLDEENIALRVIVYLRRQDTLATSWLNQQIKEGWNTYRSVKWADYIQKPSGIVLDYYKHLEKIAAVIGKENIDVHVFERERFLGGQIEADFLNAVGLEMTDDFQMPEKQSNPSLPLNYCEIKRRMNALEDLTEEDRVFLVKGMREAIPRASAYTSDWFSPEERKEFLAQWEESNQKVAREYLKPEGEHDRLFNPEIKDVPKWDENNPYMEEDLFRLMTSMFITQQREYAALQEQFRDYKERTDQKIYDLQQTALIFRVRRKWRHITGKSSEIEEEGLRTAEEILAAEASALGRKERDEEQKTDHSYAEVSVEVPEETADMP